ncbi:MAG: hypothetical protein MHPSP_003136, partial [Paramarteilia canceri]
ELFIQDFTKSIEENHNTNRGPGHIINYDDLVNTMNSKKKYNFLKEVIPDKITYSQYLKTKPKKEN